MIVSIGTPKALSEASTICFLTAGSVPAGRFFRRSAALPTRSRSSAESPAASKTPSKSMSPPAAAGAAGGSLEKTGGGGEAAARAIRSRSLSPSEDTGASAPGSDPAVAPSCTMNQPRTADPQPFFSLMTSLPPSSGRDRLAGGRTPEILCQSGDSSLKITGGA